MNEDIENLVLEMGKERFITSKYIPELNIEMLSIIKCYLKNLHILNLNL